MTIEWEMQEPGWWTSHLGGICNDGRNWYFWPRASNPDDRRIGPWGSLKEAKAKAEALSNGQ